MAGQPAIAWHRTLVEARVAYSERLAALSRGMVADLIDIADHPAIEFRGASKAAHAAHRTP